MKKMDGYFSNIGINVQDSFILSEEQLEKQDQCIIFQDNAPDKTELVLGDKFEIKVEEGKTFVVRKKPQYPKTYEECCQHLSCVDKLSMGKLISLQQLINARNAYWKIAGEEMGLDKRWEPDWSKSDPKYTIVVIENRLVKHLALTQNFILAFPTEEMRDAFYENFEDLIEQCKELL